MKKIPSISTISIAIALTSLTGCQTTNIGNNYNDVMAMTQEEQSQIAKQELQGVLQSQLTKSFSYNTMIEISNQGLISDLENFTPNQIDETKEYNCEETHDKAYIELVLKAEKADKDVYDDAYTSDRDTLRSDFLQCEDNDTAQDKNQDKNWDESYYYGGNEEESEYLSEDVEEDLQNAKVYKDYLLKPLDININGSYQPLTGKISILPMVSFNQRNLHTSIQQPIYIDARSGRIYIWAETFIPLISLLVDDQLGTSWNGKWLQLDVNDGSLPKGIEKGLLTAFTEASKTAYEEEPESGFTFVKVNDINLELPYLTDYQKDVMKNSSKIISRTHDNVTNEHQNYLWQRAFYSTLTEDYPQIFVDKEDEDTTDAKHQLNSQKILNITLNVLKKSIESYESKSELTNDEALTTKSEFFGFQNNSLSWWHVRNNFTDIDSTTEGIHVDALTTFKYGINLSSTITEGVNAPNQTNTVDLMSYVNSFIELHSDDDEVSDILDELLNDDEASYKEESEDYAETEEMSASEESENIEHDSAQCVLMSVSLDLMCEAGAIDITNQQAVATCTEEKAEAVAVFDQYCR